MFRTVRISRYSKPWYYECSKQNNEVASWGLSGRSRMKNSIRNRSIVHHFPHHENITAQSTGNEMLPPGTFRFLSTAIFDDNPGKLAHEFRREGVR
jgi:hypothetical protein